MKTWSIYTKIGAIIGIIIVSGAISASLSVRATSKLAATMDHLNNNLFEQRKLAFQTMDTQRLITLATRELILEQDPAKKKSILSNFEDKKREQDSLLEKLEAITDENGKGLIKEFKNSADEWHQIVARSRDLTFKSQDTEATKIIFEEAQSHLVQMRAALTQIGDYAAKNAQEASSNAHNLAQSANLTGVLSCIFSAVISSLLAFFVLRGMNKRINLVIGNLADNSTQVSTSSQQIASASEELSAGANQQAASLQETTASVEEISAMIGKNAKSAEDSKQISESSEISMRRGREAVGQMIQSMKEIDKSNSEIARQIEKSNQEVSEIAQVISEIGNKTKIINDIVFQTKLLSFNASVEAARAGEHGKGFAVVAEEVGNLAQMSGSAAKEINAMLEGSIKKVEGIVNSTRTNVASLIGAGKEKVQVGNDIAHHCDEAINQIAESVRQVGVQIHQIALASQEQAHGIQEINTAMLQLDQVTQQNASAAHQTSGAASGLANQAENLASAVDMLIQTIQGSNKGGPKELRLLSSNKNLLSVNFKKTKTSMTAKKVMGSDVIPSVDDPRFENV